jgi:type I restriction enzyme S subunit
MSLPRYESYKDSGVEWLGEVPEHWEVKRVKNVANINMGQSPSSQDCNQEGNGTPFLQGNADFGETNPFPRHFCSVANKLSSTGDILFSVRAPVGAINISDQIYGIGRGLCAFTPNKFNFVKFFFYALEIVKSELFSVATGSTYEAVSVEQIANAIFIAPPIIEQNAIAQFLDQETAKIDNLIAEQQQLIKLLKEKRQAVISHAVTKGLNPDVPMKDSGVEWLGEVPKHWEVLATKRLFKLVCVPAPKSHDYELLSIYTAIGVRPRKELEQKGNKATSTDGYWMVNKGDLIVNKLLAWMGAIGISEYDGVTSPAYDILRQRLSLQPKYYDFLFRCGICFSEFRRYSRGIMDMRLRLYFDEFGRLFMPYPPVDEQKLIINFLEYELNKFDILILESSKVISLLKERRSALISSAVTGKIDVRNYVPSQPQVEAMA